jgi:hypothetical protein
MEAVSKAILVFRTNLDSVRKVQAAADLLRVHSGILRWTVDKHDVDKVLRIETISLSAEDVIQLMMKAGFECEELPD